MKRAIIVVGSINLDIVVRAPRIPRPGETLLGRGVAEYPGGKGANQAVAVARAGGHVRMLGRIGGDQRGQTLRNGLAADGVDVAGVGVCKHDPTGLALITVDDAGENTIIVISGANHKIRTVHIDDAAQAGVLDDAAVLLAQLECPLDVVVRALGEARSRGLRTVLNAAPAVPLDAEVLALVDVLVVNEHELEIVTGCSGRDAALERARTQVEFVIVTLGAAGSVFVDSDNARPRTVPAFPVEPVDTTAAGDAFCGALAVALAEGQGSASAVLRGNAAGALATTVAGAQPSLPTAEAMEALIAETTSATRPTDHRG
jgi:ribokinase